MQRQQLEEARRAILQAKCRGYFFVILAIGRRVNIKEVYSFASEPNDVFFKLVDKATELNEEPLMRFGRLLPSFVSSKYRVRQAWAKTGALNQPTPLGCQGQGPQAWESQCRCVMLTCSLIQQIHVSAYRVLHTL